MRGRGRKSRGMGKKEETSIKMRRLKVGVENSRRNYRGAS